MNIGCVEDLAFGVAMRRVVELHEEVTDVDKECTVAVRRIGEAIDGRAACGGEGTVALAEQDGDIVGILVGGDQIEPAVPRQSARPVDVGRVGLAFLRPE